MTDEERARSDENNALQDATLQAVSAVRDAVQACFDSDAARLDERVFSTLRRLFAFMSERSQAISFLVSAGYVWDAEIIVRSFYEAHAKIWFICLTPESGRRALVDEFWDTTSAVHNRRRAAQAAEAAAVSRRQGDSDDALVLSSLTREDIFPADPLNKQGRRTVEQKWSFAEIVRHLQKSGSADFDLSNLGGLLHMYGQASHMIHADESALDTMLDRQLREKTELRTLAEAHVCRIFSDQAHCWLFSLMALRHACGLPKDPGPDLVARLSHLNALIRPYTERFNAGQAAFYQRCAENSD
ncbi:MAG: DUF5677 domain-containing protein [Rhizobiaceae bacterium]